MKTALIFPGQGSQFVGMGHDFYQKYDVSKQIYHSLDDTLGRNLSKEIFFGSDMSLLKTQNAQPSIMATSIAIYVALVSENLINMKTISCVAGHSLGEYSALVCNSSLKFDNSVKLLKVRSKAMQESMPEGTGGMLALIGCSLEKVNKIIEMTQNYGKVFVANDNAIGQIVISGEKNAIEYIENKSKKLEIKKAIKLPVSAPFHCELINNAATVMDEEISNYQFENFSVPLYSNVTAEKCSVQDIKKLLIKQIVSKVRWREIVLNMIRDGVKNFVEIGPGSVLTNLVKRISKEVKVISISKTEDIDKLEAMKQ